MVAFDEEKTKLLILFVFSYFLTTTADQTELTTDFPDRGTHTFPSDESTVIWQGPSGSNSTVLDPNFFNNTCSKQYISSCPSKAKCSELGACCIECEFDTSCTYGDDVTVTCKALADIVCDGERNFTREFNCRYCYQTEEWQHTCTTQSNCQAVTTPRPTYRANCSVKDHILCLGRRKFYKNRSCNWTKGYRWSTALILSVTVGGFGADRFYLGLWREGIGKLFSFGGLGVWTIVDVILIAIGYVGPYDGSLYIY
ncbi:TM2 domain-containing protein 3 [Lingula anatina]|uniref:TM2 domain-containing protein 3 n=1 Tax=Lingula anatina TaxID=7574 RepID=A0A1S3IGA3_LINAN|nr:TM2 domain-containing protein 3 [Lingula anatina]|eukprot:XP_013396896.1 TM2 domain-containing protein 3 [Lingula anatina]